ncbi:MAG TPA: biotin--[acetyl-CoA-carboxylase] ligase, partial [Gaiellaceae bacterium]|nr:biotin--[acetyl-CoA-carboxylase] ligase [Gaiellaceae bacterium]
DEQTAGRGRLGRSWAAPPGTAVLCSVLLEPDPGRNAAELSLVGGLAAAHTVEAVTGRPAGIKWPNDVLLAGRKVVGVLAETAGGMVVLGVGLNVNQTEDQLPRDARVPPTSLLACDGVRRARAPILADLLYRLELAYERWRSGGLPLLHGELAERDALRGRSVVVDGAPALAVGITSSGRLEVEANGTRRLVESGDVAVAATPA